MTTDNRAIDTLNGIGPKKKMLYNKMGIKTTEDLLSYFPVSYIDQRNPKKLSDLKVGEEVLTLGRVALNAEDRKRHGKRSFRILLDDCGSKLEVVFFNNFYLHKLIKTGRTYYVYGKVREFQGRLNMVNPIITEESTMVKEIVPIYRTVSGISQGEIRKHIKALLKEERKEYLPEAVVEKNNLCPPGYMIENLHFPKDREHYKKAKYRKIYEELFIMQLGMESMRKPQNEGIKMSASTDEFLSLLPFNLTDAQKKCLFEIEKDMSSGNLMNRLVQGDVGSGKTAVAAAAMYKAVKSGYQAVMMAPTEILAKQHYASLKGNYDKLGISTLLLTGGIKASERREKLKEIKEGNVNIIIGTHALIQGDVEYKNLGFVITDEQHRFGVNQRVKLGRKGENPHILVMTATPIPRTLAVIVYGDLDMSVIDALPAGRKKIITKEIKENERIDAYMTLKKEIKEGRQSYVVAPLIEDSEALENVKSVESLYKELNELYNGDISMGIIHGGMKQEEKDRIMEEFGNGNISMLIATSVIEVGIDVPNATRMVIENAERFGLSQLHQLRGRVGRGKLQSECWLINRGKGDVSKKRVNIMCESSDGFFISEKDLQLRGPGEIFGIRQHGIPDECLINAVKHAAILKKAQEDARAWYGKTGDIVNKKVDIMFNGSNGVNL